MPAGAPPATDAADAVPETSWSPRPEAGVAAEADPAAVPVPAGAPGRLAGLLPDTVRGGRLDPGRTGTLALLVVFVLAAVGAGAVLLQGRPQEVAAPEVLSAGEPLPGAPQPAGEPPPEIVVSVVGEVARPGIVRLPPGSRVDDAVRAAGGLRPGIDPGLVNLARKLTDGEQVLVGVGPPPGAAAGPAPGGLLDLNLATVADLDDLPGIGPVLAERIVAWRDEHGPFRAVDQLREVPGIGEAKYTSVKSKVTV